MSIMMGRNCSHPPNHVTTAQIGVGSVCSEAQCPSREWTSRYRGIDVLILGQANTMTAADEISFENFIEDDKLFGVPPAVSSEGSTLLLNGQDWRNEDLTQWFDGAIDVVGSHAATGVLSRLDDDPPLSLQLAVADETYNPWSVIEEPIVLAQTRPYYAGYNTPHDADEPPLSATNAAEMLQIPVINGQAAYTDTSEFYPTWSKQSPAEFAGNLTDELEHEETSSEADSIELAIEVLSDSVRSVSLQGDDVESDEVSQGIVSAAAYESRSGSNTPQSLVEFSKQYGVMQPTYRPGSGQVARKKMKHRWLDHGRSTYIIPDDAKQRRDRDMHRIMTMESGPRNILQPMHRIEQPGGSRWAEQLLNLCAGAIANDNVGRTQHLMWVLNELASFTGDGNQRLAAYGLKALFCRITKGKEAEATYIRPFQHQDKTLGPKAVHRALVAFHEYSPWHQASYTVTNDTLLEVFAGKSHLHIVDIGVLNGLQWPILIDALCNRPGGPPKKLRITTLRHFNANAPYSHNNQVDAESAEFMTRLVTFAKVLGLNCELNMYVGPLESFKAKDLKLQDGEVLAVCCQFRLHRLSTLVSPRTRHGQSPQRSPRDEFLEFLHTLKPSVLVVSENDVDMTTDDFLTRFKDIIHFWWSFFDSNDSSFRGREADNRGIVEYEAAMIMLNGVACEGRERIERNEFQDSWMKRIRRAGFLPMTIGDNAKKAVQTMLQRNDNEHWSVSYSLNGTNSVNLLWKEHSVIFTSVWKTTTCSRNSCKCTMLHD